MSGLLVLVEGFEGELRPGSREAIAAAIDGRAEIGGPVTVAIVDPAPEAYVAAASVNGVDQIVTMTSSAHPDSQVLQAALEQLIAAERPSVVLVGQSVSALGYAPAVAARGGFGFASDVTRVEWGAAPVAFRPAFAGKLEAELEFPDKDLILLLLRQGAFDPADVPAEVPVREIAGDLGDAGAHTEHLDLSEQTAGDVDIATARFLISVGRGIEDEDDLQQFAELAERAGATLSSSRPLVDAGWLPPSRQVGQSGKSVEPEVYLAFGISGAVQHLAGISGAKTIIAVNTDPAAPIFSVADYGAVADMFDVAKELERLLQ